MISAPPTSQQLVSLNYEGFGFVVGEAESLLDQAHYGTWTVAFGETVSNPFRGRSRFNVIAIWFRCRGNHAVCLS